MSISQSEENIFAEWRSKRPGFVSDGVVDEAAYLLSSRKLLFVLKEVNDPEGGGWDLRKILREEPRSQTWDNITRWVEGIRRISEDIAWQEFKDVDLARRCKALRSIATVNLKKSPGGHTTDHAELAKIAEEDKLYLNRQFALYTPDIIICCGTSDTFHWLVPICKQPQWQSTHRGIQFHEYSAGKFVVSYLHPSARCSPSILYYGLIDAIREILKL